MMFDQQILITHHLSLPMLKYVFPFLMILTHDLALLSECDLQETKYHSSHENNLQFHYILQQEYFISMGSCIKQQHQHFHTVQVSAVL